MERRLLLFWTAEKNQRGKGMLVSVVGWKKKKASRNIFTSKSLKSDTIILYVKDVVKLRVLKGDAYPRLQEKYPKCHHKCL